MFTKGSGLLSDAQNVAEPRTLVSGLWEYYGAGISVAGCLGLPNPGHTWLSPPHFHGFLAKLPHPLPLVSSSLTSSVCSMLTPSFKLFLMLECPLNPLHLITKQSPLCSVCPNYSALALPLRPPATTSCFLAQPSSHLCSSGCFLWAWSIPADESIFGIILASFFPSLIPNI